MPLPRRRFLGWLGVAGVGAAAGAGGVRLATDPSQKDATATADAVVPFHGAHQAGIATPRQTHAVFASLDVTGTRDDLGALLRYWTEAARRLTEGFPAAAGSGDPTHVPWDTGETEGLGPNRLTITFGVGPTLFAADRLGLPTGRPAPLAELPPFETDELDPAQTGGDLCIQACADDAQVAFHAVRELLRLGNGIVAPRWSQAGFVPRVADGATPRNLLGFRDGTNNLVHPDALDEFVWVGDEGPAWLRGGSYLVVRRIEMHIDRWDGSSLIEQEATIGRRKASGAPIGGARERDPVDLRAVDGNGVPLIPATAHIRLASGDENDGARLLRRPYSFVDRADGRLRAGLFFLAYQRDPRTQFVAIQRRLAENDALNEYIRHTGSALFAVLPGVRPGGFLGQGLFGGVGGGG